MNEMKHCEKRAFSAPLNFFSFQQTFHFNVAFGGEQILDRWNGPSDEILFVLEML